MHFMALCRKSAGKMVHRKLTATFKRRPGGRINCKTNFQRRTSAGPNPVGIVKRICGIKKLFLIFKGLSILQAASPVRGIISSKYFIFYSMNWAILSLALQGNTLSSRINELDHTLFRQVMFGEYPPCRQRSFSQPWNTYTKGFWDNC